MKRLALALLILLSMALAGCAHVNIHTNTKIVPQTYKNAPLDRSADADHKDFVTPSGHPEKTFTNVPFLNLVAGLYDLCESNALASAKRSPFGDWTPGTDTTDKSEIQYIHDTFAASFSKLTFNGALRAAMTCKLLLDDGAVTDEDDYSVAVTGDSGRSHTTQVHTTRYVGTVAKSYANIWFFITGTYPTFHVIVVSFEHNGYQARLYPLDEENLVENVVQIKLDELTNDHMVDLARAEYSKEKNATPVICVVHVGNLCTKTTRGAAPDIGTFEQFEKQHEN